MAIATTCPNCKARFRLGDDLVGKKVKCQGCAHVFVVPSAAEAAAEPWSLAPKPKADAKSKPDDEPATPKHDPHATIAAPPPAALPPAKEEEEEEERVKKKRSSGPPPTSKSGAARRERGERRDRADTGSSTTMIAVVVVLLGFGLVSCVGCMVGGGYLMFANRAAPAKPAPAPIAVDKPKPIVNAPPNAIRADFDPAGTFRQFNQITQFDPRNRHGKLHKLYAVHFEANRTYQIDMMTNEFDTYLYLTDNTGFILHQDDDGGDGLNSRIIFTPDRAGTYLIEATSLGGQRIGNYTLVVQRR